MKKSLLFVLALMMCLMTFVMCVNAQELKFTDVKESNWYYADVKNAVEKGLINGKSETIYAPDDNLTYAEAIKLAACMNQLYNEGAVTLKNGSPWYQSYVDYCVEHNIIDKEYNYNELATRAGYMVIFAHALPDEALKQINNIPDGSILDVPSAAEYAPEVYKLYRAGVLQGSDAEHNCKPLDNIKRSEVAAILTRMMDETKRVNFSMGTSSGSDDKDAEDEGTEGAGGGGTPEEAKPLAIKTQPASSTVAVGDMAETTVVAEGGKTPYTYQWQVEVTSPGGVKAWFEINEDNSQFFNETKATLLASVDTEAEKKVRCIVIDAKGDKVTSEFAILKFAAEEVPLAITLQPEDKTAEESEGVGFTVQAEGGNAPYTYQWQIGAGTDAWVDVEDNSFFAGANTASLEVALTEKTVETFRCIVTDAEGNSVTSDSATLTVTELEKTEPEVKPLKIAKQPESKNVNVGETIETYVVVEGGKTPYNYEWYTAVVTNSGVSNWSKASDSATISGSATETIKITLSNEFTTKLVCEITDADGNKVTSDEVDAIWQKAPEFKIVTEPSDTEAEAGAEATLSVKVLGGKAPYTYQWQMNMGRSYVNISDNANISGANTEKVTLKSNSVGKTDFRCVITDANGKKLTSKVATLNVVPAVVNIADTKLAVEGIEVLSIGVVVWGTLEEGMIKTGQTLYINDASGFYVTTITAEKLEKNRTVVDSVMAGEGTVGILTDLDKEKWKDAKSDGYVVSSKRGTVIVSTGGTSTEHFVTGTVVTTPVDPLKIVTQPTSITINKEAEKATASFTVEVEGGKAPYTYQWMLGNLNSKTGKFEFAPMDNTAYGSPSYIVGAKTDTLVIISTELRAFIVYCVITDADGNTVTSDTVSLSRP